MFQLLHVAVTFEVVLLRPRRSRPEMACTFTHRSEVNPFKLSLMITSLVESMALRRVNDHVVLVAPTLNVRPEKFPGMASTGEPEQAEGDTLAICPPVVIAPVEMVTAHDCPIVSGLLEISRSQALKSRLV